ncbi:hypothetical protein M8818_001465 [Zalaria obscura]|uniref:Uncharacterized protein n=1 Tax=Zalaria obscura TaxID=2024903 RepID=A0ACC3SKC7_9PEZI
MAGITTRNMVADGSTGLLQVERNVNAVSTVQLSFALPVMDWEKSKSVQRMSVPLPLPVPLSYSRANARSQYHLQKEDLFPSTESTSLPTPTAACYPFSLTPDRLRADVALLRLIRKHIDSSIATQLLRRLQQLEVPERECQNYTHFKQRQLPPYAAHH